MWFFIGFHFFFSFFKEIKKKCFFLWHLICSFKKFGDMIHEKFKKNRKMLRKRHYFQQQLQSHFWPRKHWTLDFSISIKSYRKLNFLSKNINSESIGILSRKLWPKYETDAEDNTNLALFQFSLKILNGDQQQICSSLSNRLIISLCFKRKIFEK